MSLLYLLDILFTIIFRATVCYHHSWYLFNLNTLMYYISILSKEQSAINMYEHRRQCSIMTVLESRSIGYRAGRSKIDSFGRDDCVCRPMIEEVGSTYRWRKCQWAELSRTPYYYSWGEHWLDALPKGHKRPRSPRQDTHPYRTPTCPANLKTKQVYFF